MHREYVLVAMARSFQGVLINKYQIERTSDLTHFKDKIPFTRNDLIEFGKQIFNNWKRQHERSTDEEKGKKYKKEKTRNRRNGRKRQVQCYLYRLTVLVD